MDAREEFPLSGVPRRSPFKFLVLAESALFQDLGQPLTRQGEGGGGDGDGDGDGDGGTTPTPTPIPSPPTQFQCLIQSTIETVILAQTKQLVLTKELPQFEVEAVLLGACPHVPAVFNSTLTCNLWCASSCIQQGNTFIFSKSTSSYSRLD